MSLTDKRALIRAALREAARSGIEPWGPGDVYATLDNCMKAVLNLYWNEVEAAAAAHD